MFLGYCWLINDYAYKEAGHADVFLFFSINGWEVSMSGNLLLAEYGPPLFIE